VTARSIAHAKQIKPAGATAKLVQNSAISARRKEGVCILYNSGSRPRGIDREVFSLRNAWRTRIAPPRSFSHTPGLMFHQPNFKFLLSTLAAEAWRSNAGSAKLGPVVWFILNWWWRTFCSACAASREPTSRDWQSPALCASCGVPCTKVTVYGLPVLRLV